MGGTGNRPWRRGRRGGAPETNKKPRRGGRGFVQYPANLRLLTSGQADDRPAGVKDRFTAAARIRGKFLLFRRHREDGRRVFARAHAALGEDVALGDPAEGFLE